MSPALAVRQTTTRQLRSTVWTAASTAWAIVSAAARSISPRFRRRRSAREDYEARHGKKE
jgi:hypothetical protein